MAKQKTKEPMKSMTMKGKKVMKKSEPMKVDSMDVGTKRQSIADVSKASSVLQKGGQSRQFSKGLNTQNPLKSSPALKRGVQADLVNKVIENSKKKKPNMMAASKKKY